MENIEALNDENIPLDYSLNVTAYPNYHTDGFAGSLPILLTRDLRLFPQARTPRINWFAVWLSLPTIRFPKISRNTVTWSLRCPRHRYPTQPREVSASKIATVTRHRKSMSEICHATNTGKFVNYFDNKTEL